MKMRKLLAVVLAVTMAISAMALSVFAEDYEIDLYNYRSSSTYTATYTWTATASALYGVATQGDSIVVTLPTSLAADKTVTDSVTVPETYACYNASGELVKVITAAEYEEANYSGNSFEDAGYVAILDAEGNVAWYDVESDDDTTTDDTATEDTTTEETAEETAEDEVLFTISMDEATGWTNMITSESTPSYDDFVTAVNTSGAYIELTFTLADDEDDSVYVALTLQETTNYSSDNNYNIVAANYTVDGNAVTVTVDDLTNLIATMESDTYSAGAQVAINPWNNTNLADGTVTNVSVVVKAPDAEEEEDDGSEEDSDSEEADAWTDTAITIATYNSGDYSGNTYDDEYKTVEVYTTTTTTTTVVVPAYDYEISYSLTVNGVTVQLKNPSNFDVDLNGDGVLDESAGDYDASKHYGVYAQTIDISTFARDYSAHANWTTDGKEVNATVPQTTLVSETTPIIITATIDYSSTGDSSTLAQSWEFAASWWPSWDAQAEFNYLRSYYNGTTYTVEVTEDLGKEYGYTVRVEYYDGSDLVGTAYAANGLNHTGPDTDKTTSQDNVVIIKNVGTDLETSQPLAWDHNLTSRGIILTATQTEGATAKVVVELDGTVKGMALYTLNTVTDIASSEVWADDAWWYTTASNNSALNVTAASTYVLANESTDTLVFENVPLSTLYDSNYGLYNSYMSITQVITAKDNSGVDYYYYTNSTDNSLEATRVYLVISMPDDETLEVNDPVEPGDTDTEDEGTEDLTVNEPADVEPETNPTTGIVLALVPMAVAAAAAVASKRR